MDSWKPEDGKTDPLGRHNHILKHFSKDELPKEIFELEKVKNFLLPK
jgi:hypothetical protein